MVYFFKNHYEKKILGQVLFSLGIHSRKLFHLPLNEMIGTKSSFLKFSKNYGFSSVVLCYETAGFSLYLYTSIVLFLNNSLIRRFIP